MFLNDFLNLVLVCKDIKSITKELRQEVSCQLNCYANLFKYITQILFEKFIDEIYYSNHLFKKKCLTRVIQCQI